MDAIRRAIELYNPVKIYALLSGGKDSLPSTDYAMENGAHEVLHINTEIGVDEGPSLSVRMQSGTVL